MVSECLKQARDFWLSQRLRYLVPLKYTHLYGDVVACECDAFEDSFGVLLHYATADVFWDLSMYPTADRIVIPTARDSKAANRLRDQVHSRFAGQQLVFKFSEVETRDVFLAVFPLTYVRTLISYTAPHVVDATVSDPVWQFDEAVVYTSAPDEAVLALYRANGYTADELHSVFLNGALSFAIFEHDMPVCACLAYQNFETIWEIGGLHTVPEVRRQGYGRRVVESALTVLMERALIPRYLVDSTNRASVYLAESLGLVAGLHFEHYSM